MLRPNKKSIFHYLIVGVMVFVFSVSAFGGITKPVFAENNGIIQLNGMAEVDKDGYAVYKDITGSEVGKIIGVETAGGFSADNKKVPAMKSDGSSSEWQGLNVGTYKFTAIAVAGKNLNVMVGGSPITVTPAAGQADTYTFEVSVAAGSINIVNPSFGSAPGPGPNPDPQPNKAGLMIWIDGITGNGTNGAVIDDSVNPAVTAYEGNGFKIEKGTNHAAYELKFTADNISIGAVKVQNIVSETNGILAITPASAEGSNSTIKAENTGANSGYSIYSEDMAGLPSGTLSVETTEKTGKGDLQLEGGVNLSSAFSVLDRRVSIGKAGQPSSKGIVAGVVIVKFGELNMNCSDTLLEGVSDNNRLFVDVIYNGKLNAVTSKSTGTALNNVADMVVMCGGDIDIEHSAGCTLGGAIKKVAYYTSSDFGKVELSGDPPIEVSNVTIISDPDLTVGDGNAEGHNGKYSMDLTANHLKLTSLSKPLYILAFNTLDDNGNIVEANEVKNGTVKVEAACGIGTSMDGKPCTFFQIEEGSTVTITLKPDYGYQFTSAQLTGKDGETVISASDTAALSEEAKYTFTMPAGNMYLSTVFTKVKDSVNVSNADIKAAAIGNLEGQMNGNAKFSVEKVDKAKVNEASFEAKAEGMSIASYEELSLKQVIKKGASGEAWKKSITELDKPSRVTLKVSDEIAKKLDNNEKVGVIRQHGNETTLLKAEYNADTDEITFDTDSYSTYAIAYKAKAGSSQNASKTAPKTGDTSAPYICLLLMLAAGSTSVILKKRSIKR